MHETHPESSFWEEVTATPVLEEQSPNRVSLDSTLVADFQVGCGHEWGEYGRTVHYPSKNSSAPQAECPCFGLTTSVATPTDFSVDLLNFSKFC